MSDPDIPYLLRVEKGSPDAIEVAALAAVLYARLARLGTAPDCQSRRTLARWRRPERAPGFDGPRTWWKSFR
jgi:Acyl-CoA carboxylase epsilon subunit